MKQDKLIAIIILCILGAAYYLTFEFPFRSALYPRSIIIITALLSTALFLKAIIREKKKIPVTAGEEAAPDSPEAKYHLFVSLIITLAYILIIPVLGYFLTTAIYIFTLMTLLKTDRKITLLIIIVSVSVTLILYGVFGVALGIWVPRGLFF